MALAISSRAVSVAFGTVSFYMVDQDETVRVDVSQDLLARVDGFPPTGKRGYIERLERHKYLFAHIAAFKYLKRDYEPEVRVPVVRITADDLDSTYNWGILTLSTAE